MGGVHGSNNVFDVVGQPRDGLAHGSKSFILDLILVELSVFHCSPSSIANGIQEHKVLLVEFAGASGICVDDADNPGTATQRRAHGRAYIMHYHTLGQAELGIGHGVSDEH